MKTIALFVIGAAFAFALTADVRSQATPPPIAPARSPLGQLQAMKVENAKLLEKQAATLLLLEDMRVQAQQLKAFTKRS